jgi:glycosyltransferase involved in cell wall biosynthesis
MYNENVILINHTSSYTGVGKYVNDIVKTLHKSVRNVNVIFNRYQLKNQFPSGETVKGLKSTAANIIFKDIIFKDLKKKLEEHKKNGGYVHYAESSMPRITNSVKREIVTFHDIFPLSLKGLTLHSMAYKHFTNIFLTYENAIAISNYTRDRVVESGFSGNIEVIHNMVDESIYKPIDKKDEFRSEFGIPKDKKVIISVSTDIPRKNLKLLYRIAKELKDEYELVRVGPSIGIGLHYENIDFYDLVKLYNSADVFILTSTEEGFNFPTAEAMSCGLPVVVSDIPIMKEIVGEAGLLADLNEPGSFIESIHKASDNADYYRFRSIERAKEFSSTKYNERMRKFYDNLD